MLTARSHDGSPRAVSSPHGFAVAVDPGSAPDGRVRVTGELDLATAPLLAEQLDAMATDGYRRLELDLHGVLFCDVAGLSVLLDAHALLRARGGSLVVHGPCPSLRRLLDVLGLTLAFEPATSPPS